MDFAELEQDAEARRLREQLSGLRESVRECAVGPIPVVDGRTHSASPNRVKDEIEKVTKRIADVRSAARVPAHERNAKVVALVIDALGKRGAFFHDHLTSYLFLKDQRVLLPIDLTEEGLELVLDDYGLNPIEQVTKQVIQALRLHARKRGQATEVHAFAHYSRSSNTVYVYDFAGGVYRLTSEGIERVDNGTDGVLFIQNPNWEPLNLDFSVTQADWRSWLLSGIRFVAGVLSEADQRLLFVSWVLALFFPQLFPTRIILALIGEKGSGKSSLLRRVGQLLFGPKFNVSALTSKPDDFDAAITTDSLVVADNADDAPNWFPDKLAVLATGGSIKRRILYSTNRLGEFPILANVAVTSRTPNFTREDVAERLLPLNVQRIHPFEPESALLADLLRRRNEIVSAIVADVWRALVALGRESGRTYPTQFRMADFADFVLKIAPVLGTQDEMRSVLDRLANQQVALASEDEPLFGLIDVWLQDESQHVNIDRDIPLSELGTEIEQLVAERLPWERGSPKSFGQYVRARKGTLRSLYGMTERRGHAGTALVSFRRHRNGDLGDLGDRKSRHSPIYQDEFERTEGQK